MLYVLPTVQYIVNGDMAVQIASTDALTGREVVQNVVLPQPSPWTSDADVLAVVEAQFPNAGGVAWRLPPVVSDG